MLMISIQSCVFFSSGFIFLAIFIHKNNLGTKIYRIRAKKKIRIEKCIFKKMKTAFKFKITKNGTNIPKMHTFATINMMRDEKLTSVFVCLLVYREMMISFKFNLN